MGRVESYPTLTHAKTVYGNQDNSFNVLQLLKQFSVIRCTDVHSSVAQIIVCAFAAECLGSISKKVCALHVSLKPRGSMDSIQ